MPSGVYVRTKEMNTGKYIRTDEHNRKNSEGQKGRKLSDEHKQKISKTLKKTNAKRKQELGYVCSPETKKKISETKQKRKQELGYVNSPKTRKKISKTLKKTNAKKRQELGYVNSPKTRKKISETMLKRKELGYVVSSETRKKMSDARIKTIQERRTELGYAISPKVRKRMSEAMLKRREELGYILSPEVRNKISEVIQKRKTELGYVNSPEVRKKMGRKGENHHRWNPNRTEVYSPYGENFYNKKIRNRKWNLQNSRDMLTGTILDPNKRPAYHHIDYCKSNDDPDNHCFVSNSNHARITGYQRISIKSERYKKILQENTLALKNGQIPKNWSPLNKELFKQEKLKQLNLSYYI